MQFKYQLLLMLNPLNLKMRPKMMKIMARRVTRRKRVAILLLKLFL